MGLGARLASWSIVAAWCVLACAGCQKTTPAAQQEPASATAAREEPAGGDPANGAREDTQPSPGAEPSEVAPPHPAEATAPSLPGEAQDAAVALPRPEQTADCFIACSMTMDADADAAEVDTCVARCVACLGPCVTRNMARAVAAEQIDADCAVECVAQQGETP